MFFGSLKPILVSLSLAYDRYPYFTKAILDDPGFSAFWELFPGGRDKRTTPGIDERNILCYPVCN